MLPTHNRADVLGYAIRSVLWQTEDRFELLIVGDGCTDNTREVVASFHDPRIRWFDLPKAPHSGYANRNLVLREARGEYIAYAQHDDIMLPDHISRLLATMERSEAEWCYSRPLWCTPEGLILPFAIDLTNADELDRFLHIKNHIPSSCVMHTRESLRRVGFWPEDVARTADWLCWQRIITTSPVQKVGYCSVPTCLHFRANWRLLELKAVRRLEGIARASAWWPQACRVEIPAGSVEQQIVFQAIAAGPEAYVEQLRAGVARIIERLAWDSVARIAPALPPSLPAN